MGITKMGITTGVAQKHVEKGRSMREVVLDTETTGLSPAEGDRIVEIGCLELHKHMPTGRSYHQYINPQRAMPREAFEVHGLGVDLLEPPQTPQPGQITLRDKPVFADIGSAFADFIGESPLVIHNAEFDMAFLNAELEWAGLPLVACRIIDTLALTKQRFPGAAASLDALCRRFSIDNSARTLHGALLDAEILAAVYLELIGGSQPGFDLGPESRFDFKPKHLQARDLKDLHRPKALPARLSEADKNAHKAFIADMEKTTGTKPLWRTLQGKQAAKS